MNTFVFLLEQMLTILSPTRVRDSVLNLIIAGRDTTGQALAWTFFRLMAQPELFDPIREEADAYPVVDYDNYKNMTQTLAVFHEGLRLHPSVPKNFWIALGDDQIPGGPFVKVSSLCVPTRSHQTADNRRIFQSPERRLGSLGRLGNEQGY